LYQAFVKNTTFAEAVLTLLTLSNKEVAQYRFKNLVLRRLEVMRPVQSAPHAGAQEYGQMLQFDFASVDVKQEAGPPPTAGPRPWPSDIGRTIRV
jgi:hypothetical protein